MKRFSRYFSTRSPVSDMDRPLHQDAVRPADRPSRFGRWPAPASDRTASLDVGEALDAALCRLGARLGEDCTLPAALAARRASFSFARFRSSALRARISAIRSAIGTSNRCFGLL